MIEILNISQHLAKLDARVELHLFSRHGVQQMKSGTDSIMCLSFVSSSLLRL